MKTFIYVDRLVKANSEHALELIKRDSDAGMDILLSTCTTAEKNLADEIEDKGVSYTSITPEKDLVRIFGGPDKTPCLELDTCPRVIKEAYMKRIHQAIKDSDNVILIGSGDINVNGLVNVARKNFKNVIIVNYINRLHTDAELFTDAELQENTKIDEV